MKLIIALLSLLAVFCVSCGTSTKKFRAKKMGYSTVTGKYIAYGATELINVDSSFRVGDTISYGSGTYLIIK